VGIFTLTYETLLLNVLSHRLLLLLLLL